MHKTALIENTAKATSMPKAHVEKIFDEFTSQISQALRQGDEVALKGFGSFSIVDLKARQGRNPATGKTITIPASKKPKFRASKLLKDALQKK